MNILPPPRVGSHVESGWYPQNFRRGVVLSVLRDEPSPGRWVAVVRIWQKHRRSHWYEVIRELEYTMGLWRPSPRVKTWPELEAECMAKKSDP